MNNEQMREDVARAIFNWNSFLTSWDNEGLQTQERAKQYADDSIAAAEPYFRARHRAELLVEMGIKEDAS